MLGYSEIMSIRARIIILPLSIVLYYCLTKTSYLTFIRCNNIRLQSFWMVTSVRAPSWHDDVHACALTCFVPYPLHKFRLTLPFSYMWLCNIYVLTFCHVLSVDYVCVWIVNLFSFFLRLHAVETLFCTVFFCLHVVSCPVSFCLHAGFNSFSSCLHVGLDFFLVLPNLNHIYNTLLVWGWSHLKGIYVFPPHYHVTKFCE